MTSLVFTASTRASSRKKGKTGKTLDASKTWGWGKASTKSGGYSNDTREVENVGLSTLGGKSFIETFEFNAMTYIELVKKTFKKIPSVYVEFKKILGDIRKTSSNKNKVELIKRIVVLFDGYHDLIWGFSHFLPAGMTMEVQDHAVVLNVEDYEEGSDYEAQEFSDEEEDTDMMRYMRNVKWTYMHQPTVYDVFQRVLQDFNRKSVNEVDTVARIVGLFKDQPDLVLGFNTFLSSEYKILENMKHGYVVRHPCKKGMRPHYTPVNVKEVYLQ